MLAVAWYPAAAPAKKRGTAAAKRCAAKSKARAKKAKPSKARPRACRARSTATWELLRERHPRGILTDLSRRATVPAGPTGQVPGTTGPAPGAAPSPVYSRFVSATARETPRLSLALSRPIVGAGTVTIQLQNRGEDPHSLELSTAPGQPPLTGIPTQGPGDVASMAPTLGRGSYYLYCALGDHESRGMHASLEVR